MAVNTDSIRSIRSMVMSFRVAELHSLLEYAGEKKQKLRLPKKELQKKAMKLITKKRIANKVKSIYKRMMGNGSDDDEYVPEDLKGCYDECFFDENRFPSYETYLNDCSNSFSDTSYYSHVRSEEQYFTMFTKNLDMNRLNNVQFRSITFYKHENNILPITPLIPKKQEDDFFLFEKTFSLDSETSRVIFSDGSRYQALLRFCVLNNEMEVTDQIPGVVCVKVNNQICSVPTLPSVGSRLGLSKRSPPIDITLYLENRSRYGNSLSIEWSVDYYTLYGIVIQLMKKHTSEELINNLKAKGERDASVSKKFIYDSLNEDDNEISATTLKMSLICPVSKMPIKLPTRGTTCNHLQCFDGCSYIQINELKSTWICPVCSQTCLYENLFIDGYFTDILKSDKFLPNTRDVELDPDGSWRPVIAKEKRGAACRNMETVPEEILGESKIESNAENKNGSVENDDFLESLKDFLYHYTNPDSVHSNFSKNDGLSLNIDLPLPSSRNDPEGDSAISLNEPSSNNPNGNSPKKKEVLLVDLTVSDSDSDDIRSLSSSSYASWSPTIDPFRNHDLNSRNTTSPPLYDIDSDSDSSF